MRLLRSAAGSKPSLTKPFYGTTIPPYAILSHTWEPNSGEIIYRDFVADLTEGKSGLRKMMFCAEQAYRDGLEYFWIDSCCIDQSSSQELSEAIRSMFRWYMNAQHCYVYLSDVSATQRQSSKHWIEAFRKSRWFTRGWTLQELLAPESVRFYSKEGTFLGDKTSLQLEIHDITGIPYQALQGKLLSQFTVSERMSWAENRQTTRGEDKAYSLLGIFDIHMPLLYGEGQENALRRLERQVEEENSQSPENLTAESSNDRMRRYEMLNELHLDAKRGLVESLSEERKDGLVASLRYEHIENRESNIRRAHEKTCKWLLGHDKFLEWLDPNNVPSHHGLLWIKGKPGTGKSTLMKFIYKELREQRHDAIHIAFFFNARGSKMEQITLGVYRSLLFQLFTVFPPAQSVLGEISLLFLPPKGSSAWALEVLMDILRRAIHFIHEEKRELFIFVDALDECEEDPVRELVRYFESLGNHIAEQESELRLLVCFSSRHYPRINAAKKVQLVLENEGDHAKDIGRYVLNELGDGHNPELEWIRSEIERRADGVFIWAVVVVRLLNKAYDKGQIHMLKKRLVEIPDDLSALFESILSRDKEDLEELRVAIQCVLFAQRPLHRAELFHAIVSGTSPGDLASLNHSPDDMEAFIISSSKGLAELTRSKNPTVQFIHESVRNFLHQNGTYYLYQDSESDIERKGHEVLKQSCANYLSFVYRNHDLALNSTNFPLLEYSACNLLNHADAAAAKGVPQELFLKNFPVQDFISARNKFPYKDEVLKPDSSLPYILALGNHSALIRTWLRIDPVIDTLGGHCRTPFLAALAYQKVSALKELLTPDPNHPLFDLLSSPTSEEVVAILNTYRGHPPWQVGITLDSVLWFFLARGTESVALALLRSGKFPFDASQPRASGTHTPLFHATQLGHSRVVDFLVRIPHQQIDIQDALEQTPLSRAAESGYTSIVERLVLSGDTNINSRSRTGQTPLAYAAEKGHERVVKILLRASGIEVNTQDALGRTPLTYAAEKGHEGVLRALLEVPDIDVNTPDLMGRTPLFHAANRGHDEIVTLVLKAPKVDPGAQDFYGQSPLSYAALHGNESTVQLLLEDKGINANTKDSQGRTPLMFAAQHEHNSTVQLLLETPDIEINAVDQRGRTALIYACLKGGGDIVRQLLQTGLPDFNHRDQSRKTSLGFAVAHGHIYITKLLLSAQQWDIHEAGEEGEAESLLELAELAGNSRADLIDLLREHCGCPLCQEDEQSDIDDDVETFTLPIH